MLKLVQKEQVCQFDYLAETSQYCYTSMSVLGYSSHLFIFVIIGFRDIIINFI